MAKKQTFEQAMTRLEEIVNLLEKGEAPLEESLALFQEGTKLVSTCSRSLNEAQQQLKILLQRPEGPQIMDFVGDEE